MCAVRNIVHVVVVVTAVHILKPLLVNTYHHDFIDLHYENTLYSPHLIKKTIVLGSLDHCGANNPHLLIVRHLPLSPPGQ